MSLSVKKSFQEIATDKKRDQIASKDFISNLLPADALNPRATQISAPEDDCEELMMPLFTRKPTFFAKAFSSLGPGSLRGSIFALMATALGAGILALPKMCLNIGLIPAMIFILGGAIIAVITMSMLIKASTKMEINNYSPLVQTVFGKGVGMFFDIFMLIYIIGAIISYQIIISKVFQFILGTLFSVELSGVWIAVGIVIQTTIAMPLGLARDLSGLRYATIFGIGMIFYILIAVVIESPFYMTNSHWNSSQIKLVNGGWKDYITSIGVTIFAYQSHTMVLPMRQELNRPFAYRFSKIKNRSIFIEFVLYALMGLFGYISTPLQVADLVIERKNLDGGTDYPMLVGQFGMLVTLLIAIPINLHPARVLIFTMLKRSDNITYKAHVIVSTVVMYFTAGIAIIYPNIYSALGIIGGFCGTLVMITFPGYLYIACSEKKNGLSRVAIFLFITIITILGWFSAILTILETFT